MIIRPPVHHPGNGYSEKITTSLTRDQDLHHIHEILAGRTDHFKYIIKSTRGLVTQIVHRLISKEWYRDDIIQEVYIKVFQNLHHFRNESKLSTWIAKVAYHYCLNELKTRRMNILEPEEILIHFHEPDPDPVTLIMQSDLKEKMQLEIDQLPPIYKLIVGLYHQEEQSIEEIKKITGMASGTIKNYLFRARALLAKRLREKYNKTELKS